MKPVTCLIPFWLPGLLLLTSCGSEPVSNDPAPILERLQPAPQNGGFRMPGYLIWGGSIIEENGEYHLFASRWPTWEVLGIEFEPSERASLLSGYRDHSEIVRAVAQDPLGPYTFAEVVLAGRGGSWWDGQMCHNPKILRSGGRYLLYYIGRSTKSRLRRIGYTWSESIRGPWQRCDSPLTLTSDANNPAPFIYPDGRVLLAFRDQNLVNYIALADHYDAVYQIKARDIMPGIRLEDPTIFSCGDLMHMVIEDNRGQLTGDVRHGAHLISGNGLEWRPHRTVKAYTHTVEWRDGSSTMFDRRERPELLNLNAPAEEKYGGEPTHLVTGVQLGRQSWCLVQEIAPPD